ncbi:MAG: rhombosortase [Thermodesulfobacteriota bacterium]|nr:rhombosortase [Thermodesulfobacteriota bacterium]
MTTHAINRTTRTNCTSLTDRILAVLPSVDVMGFVCLLVFFNGHLLGNGDIRSFLFLPDAVTAGQWWRIITHPFVHITWYHLLLDAGAFLVLYTGLKANTASRLVHVALCGAFSLAAACLFSLAVYSIGLSGIAHGLMAISALEMMQSKSGIKIGTACLLLVVTKSIYELFIGDAFFSFLHFGLCGTPLVACHAGGVTGGIVSFYLGKIIYPRGGCGTPRIKPEADNKFYIFCILAYTTDGKEAPCARGEQDI